MHSDVDRLEATQCQNTLQEEDACPASGSCSCNTLLPATMLMLTMTMHHDTGASMQSAQQNSNFSAPLL